MSFNTQGQDAELNSVIGGDDKAGFEGNVAGYISAALSISTFLLNSTFYTSETQSDAISRCLSLEDVY